MRLTKKHILHFDDLKSDLVPKKQSHVHPAFQRTPRKVSASKL